MIFSRSFCYVIAKGEKMLEYLRNAADKPLAKLLMFILIFSFVGWGAAEWIFGNVVNDTTLINVGNADISVQQFNNERSRELSAMTKDEQRTAYTDPVKSAELTKNVMTALTRGQLLTNRVNDLGLVVSEKRIADEIRANPQFQINGEFVPWMFDMALQNSGMNESDIMVALLDDILRKNIVSTISVPMDVPQFTMDAMYNARYAKRDIKYTTVKFSDFKTENPNEEQLKEYYVQNPRVIPETRIVSYVFVPADMNKPDIYDEKFKVAQQIEDMIISGESMKDAAHKHKATFMQVADIQRDEKLTDEVLSDDLVAKLFSMDMGMESELLELKNGFAILRVDEIHAAHNAEFDSVKKDLVNGWKKSEQRKKAYVRANELLVDLNDGKGLKNGKSVVVTRTDGATLELLNAAFANPENTNLIVEDKDAFYVLHVDKTVLPKTDDKKVDAMRNELKNMSVNYAMDDYFQFLKRKYPVKVNDKVFRKFVAK